MIEWLAVVAVYLGLAEEDLPAYLRYQCRHGRHGWGLWSRDTTPVPLMVCNDGEHRLQAGWEYVPVSGPYYRSCQRPGCAALERGVTQITS